MKRSAVVPNVLTALGLTLGLSIIFKLVTSPTPAPHETLVSCFLFFIIAAVLDVLDGTVARILHAQSEFGGFFDSMSDAVTFGVAPAVFVLKAFAIDAGASQYSMPLLVSATVYSVAGVLRLVRFSTSYVPPDQKSVFTGLPIPAAAFSVASLTLLLIDSKTFFALHQKHLSLVISVALLFIGYLMISRWRFPSLKAINIKMDSFRFILLLVCVAALFFVLLSNNIPIAVAVGVWGYVFISWFVALYRLARGFRSLAINDASDLEEDHAKEQH